MRKFLIGGGLLLCLPGAFWYLSQRDLPRSILEARYAGAPSQFVMLPNGTRAHVRDRGPRDALALLLIHGSNASLYTWEPWAKQLSDQFRVVTVDLPGHGLTGAVPSRDYTQEGMVKFIDEIADILRLHRFAIGGNSMRARIRSFHDQASRTRDAPRPRGGRVCIPCRNCRLEANRVPQYRSRSAGGGCR